MKGGSYKVIDLNSECQKLWSLDMLALPILQQKVLHTVSGDLIMPDRSCNQYLNHWETKAANSFTLKEKIAIWYRWRLILIFLNILNIIGKLTTEKG